MPYGEFSLDKYSSVNGSETLESGALRHIFCVLSCPWSVVISEEFYLQFLLIKQESQDGGSGGPMA